VKTPETKPSTPRLSDVARHVVFPDGIVTTAWPRIVAQCQDMGVEFDTWQHGIGSIALGKRKDGKYAATVGGVVLSIPRQVGKTFLVGMIVIALCVLFPGMTVLWTAHRTRTSTMTFQSLQAMVKRKKIWPHVAAIRTANGEQEILFTNGSVIMFGAREQGFGRGFDEVDVEVFDEAQILTSKALEDIVPAANQSRQPSGALLFFMGTPPRPTDPGEEFTNRRKKALAGEANNMVYVEFSADEDADPDDREQWAKANPSFPSRTPVESIERMRENLTDEASFKREGLGIWDANTSQAVIDPIAWGEVKDPASMAIENLALGISATPDRSMATVSLAGQRADDLWHVEVDEQRGGMSWVVRHVADRCAKNKIRAVVIDGADPAVSLVDEFKKAGITVTVTTTRQVSSACGQLYDSVIDTRDVRHIDQPQLNVALSLARKKKLGIGWVWDPLNSPGDITPTTSMTSALWGARSTNVKRAGRGRQASTGRRAVVL